MNPRANYFVVGLFVIVVGAATIIFSLWLAFGYGQAQDKTYLIEMHESVAGLSLDAPVKFNGVSVGTVQDISLNPSDPSLVMIKIGIEPNTPITVDTRATLTSQGLTGLSYINLRGGDSHSPPLLPAKGQPYAVIPTNPSLFLRMDASIDKLSQSLDKISKSVSYLLRDENQQNVTTILNNMAEVSGTMAEQTLPAMNQSLLMLQNILPNLSNLTQTLSEDPSILVRGQKQREFGPGESAHG